MDWRKVFAAAVFGLTAVGGDHAHVPVDVLHPPVHDSELKPPPIATGYAMLKG
jgi:hypothetical protein